MGVLASGKARRAETGLLLRRGPRSLAVTKGHIARPETRMQGECLGNSQLSCLSENAPL